MHEKLKAAIEDAGLSQKALAELLGMTESKLSRVLNGRVRITVEDAEAILTAVRTHTGRKRGLTLNDVAADLAKAAS